MNEIYMIFLEWTQKGMSFNCTEKDENQFLEQLNQATKQTQELFGNRLKSLTNSLPF